MNDLDKASNYAQAAITAFVEAGVVKGDGDGQFDPKGVATRAQVIQLLMNILQIMPETKPAFQ